MIESIFKLSDSIRYVAVYKNGQLESKSKSNTLGASSSDSDRDLPPDLVPLAKLEAGAYFLYTM